MKLGGIEAGGTKMVCAIGDENGTIFDKAVFPTQTPETTIPDMIAYFKDSGIQALGIGCFGPIDLNPKSETYGYITKTPKLAWADYNIVGAFQDTLGVPVGFDTDVNGAILGEVTWGAAKDCESAIYITVGTGVGVGVYINGKLLHGLVHPEGGHMLLSKHPEDSYKGRCPFHPNCVEGLAAGPAVEERWGKKGVDLADNQLCWEMEAYYLGQAITNYICCYSPEKVILWGGIMHQEHIFPMVRQQVQKLLNGYVHHDAVLKSIDNYIIPPALGDDPGIKGAIKLGDLALHAKQ